MKSTCPGVPAHPESVPRFPCKDCHTNHPLSLPSGGLGQAEWLEARPCPSLSLGFLKWGRSNSPALLLWGSDLCQHWAEHSGCLVNKGKLPPAKAGPTLSFPSTPVSGGRRTQQWQMASPTLGTEGSLRGRGPEMAVYGSGLCGAGSLNWVPGQDSDL